MKSKKNYLYGILMLLVLMAFVGCSANKDLGDEGIKTPEDLVIAYIQEFSQENFNRIETMFEKSANVGNEYYTESQLAPKNNLEIIESQNLFITHFYGEDAWDNVEYDIITNIEEENETDTINEYRANLVFNDSPLHLMGYENLHIIVSNESGDWMVKEGLSWDVNLYGGGPAPDYFKGSEANYRTVDRDHRPEDVMYVLGNTMNREETEEDGYYTFDLKYGDAIFYFFSFGDENGELDNNYTLDGITVQSGEYSMLRDIKIGDSFYETMSKFPRERDWLSDPDNIFYGNGTAPHDTNSFGGTCHSWVEDDGTKRDSINIKDQDCVATINFQFYNGILELMDMYYISYL